MMIEINYQYIAPETLENLLTEIVLREGTDYGEVEVSLEEKKNNLYRQLTSEKATIIYLEKEDFFDVMPVSI